jgi:hypothetical protein
MIEELAKPCRTLVHLRTHLPHAAPAELYGGGRSTVSEAIKKLRHLLAQRGLRRPRPARAGGALAGSDH